jgi:hypothetical protein
LLIPLKADRIGHLNIKNHIGCHYNLYPFSDIAPTTDPLIRAPAR